MAAHECCSRASRLIRSARRACSLRSAAIAALEVFTSHAGLQRAHVRQEQSARGCGGRKPDLRDVKAS